MIAEMFTLLLKSIVTLLLSVYIERSVDWSSRLITIALWLQMIKAANKFYSATQDQGIDMDMTRDWDLENDVEITKR